MKQSKKMIALVVAALMVISMVACGQQQSDTPAKDDGDPVESSAFVLEREANMYISYSAGGGSDRMFRAFQPYLEKNIGKSLNPIYLPGAEGLIGWTSLLSSTPDGYNIGVLNIPSATASIVSGAASFDVDSFEYLGGITYEPPLLIIAKDNKWGIETTQDLIDYAKANPGEVTIAHTGTGGDEYIAIRTLAEKAGIEVKDVPFEDTASAVTSVLGQHVYASVTSAYAVINYLEQDQIIPLAMGCEERLENFPDIPTFQEFDIDLVMGGVRGIVAPLGMDQAAIDFWVDAIEKMVNDPEYQAAAADSGTALQYMAPEEFKEIHQSLYEEYKALYEKEPW